MALTEVPDVPLMDLRTALGDHLEYVEQESFDSVSLTAEQLILPAERFTSGEFFVVGHYPGHMIGSTRYDLVDFCAERDSYRLLGLAVLGAVFGQCEVAIELHCPVGRGDANNGKPIRELVIDGRGEGTGVGLVFRPVEFHYGECSPGEDHHPMDLRRVLESEMPTMMWTNDDRDVWRPEHFENRDVVEIAGPLAGLDRLIVTLFDVGSPRATLRRFELEGPSGFQALGGASCWARLWVGFDYVEP